MNTLLKKAAPQIKSTNHPRKVQWDRLKDVYLKHRPVFDLRQLAMKNLDKKDGKKNNLGYSKKAKDEFYRWFVEYFGSDGEMEPSPIIPSQKMFNEFRNYAYMLHPDKTIIGGTRVFPGQQKEIFTLIEYKKMAVIDGMNPQQRSMLNPAQLGFYERNKKLYQRAKGSFRLLKAEGTL